MSVVIETGVTDTELPHIGWRSITGTITASTSAEGFAAALAALPETYNAWKPTALPATWEVDAGEVEDVDYCAIGAHDLGTQGATVAVEYFDGADWEEVSTATPTDDSALLLLFPEEDTASRWRIRITGTTMPRIGNIRFGSVTVLPRMSRFAPELPITEADSYVYNVNVSSEGEWLGRSVVAGGLQFEVNVANVPETFAAGEWAAFRTYCNEGGATFFVAPKPAAYPADVAYAWPTETVRAQRTLANSAASRTVQLKCGGYNRP